MLSLFSSCPCIISSESEADGHKDVRRGRLQHAGEAIRAVAEQPTDLSSLLVEIADPATPHEGIKVATRDFRQD